MISKHTTNGSTERLRIQEKALSNLADTIKKYDDGVTEEIRDLKIEIKALKLFLTRNMPEFKKEFPEFLRKLQ
jgi:hypothetical protein